MKCKLGDIVEVTMGQSPKSEFYNADGKGTPFLQGNRTFGSKYPTFDTFTTFVTKQGRAGDVIMSVRAPVGDVNITPVDICLGRGVCSLRMKNGSQEFLYYMMRHYAQALINRESGTVFGSVNKNDVNGLDVEVPSEETQRKIAEILSALDDKIELNRRINTNLEEQATAIYAKFFPYETTDALPEGWRVGTVGEIVEIHDSKRVPLSAAERMKMENKKFPYYGAASLMDYVEDYLFDGKYLLLGEDGTVVDAKGGPILQYVWGKFWVNNHAHVLTGKLGFNVESLMLLFKQTYVKPIVTGAVQPKISQANLRSLPIIVPPMERLNYFNDKVASLFTQYRVNEEQNKVLTTVRDALLPRLMSGEIDVSDVSL